MKARKRGNLRLGKGLALCLALVMVFGMCLGHISVRAEGEGGSALKVLHYYSFNEADATDYFQNGKDGELVGAVEFAEGKYGQALKLGGGSFVKFPTDIIPTSGSFTISLWAYTQSGDNQNSRLVSTGVWGGNTPGIELGVHTNVTADGSWADVTYGIGKTDADSYFGYSGAVPYDAIHEAWAHVVYVYNADENQIKVYINGEEKGSFGCEGYQPASRMQDFALGGHLEGNSVNEAFTGLIDDVAIFGQALTAEEVGQIRDGELSAQVALPEMSEDTASGEIAVSGQPVGSNGELSVLHYYSFNGEDAADYFQNGKNGELVGTVEFSEGKYGQALKLGGGSFVKFPTDIIPASGSFTISLWVYSQSGDNQNSRLVSTGVWGGNTPGIELGVHTNVTADGSWADVTYGIGKADADSYFGYSGAVPYDAIHEAWAHVVYVYNMEENQIKVYINGAEKGSFGCEGYQPASRMQDFALGGHLEGNSVNEAFTGLIDDVAIFGQALTAEEVGQIRGGELSAQVALPETTEDPSGNEDVPGEEDTSTDEDPSTGEDAPSTEKQPAVPPAKADNEQGLLHYYSFDEGNVADFSAKGIDGELVGNVSFAEGKFGKALKLDGASYVKFPAELLPVPESFTISMWVYNQTEDNALARLLSTGCYGPDTPGLTFGVHTNVTSAGNWADLTFGVGREEGEGNFHFSYAVPYTSLHESWSHVALVCDAENKLMIVYVNGEEKDRLDYTGCQIISDMTQFALGGHLVGDSLGEPFTGMIDDMTIFDRVLTESEVVQMGSGKYMNTVTFEANGGTPVDSVVVFAGGTIKEPESVRASAEGEGEWQLVGWSINPDAYEPYNFEKPVREDMTLYAMWRQGDQVTVSFEGFDDLAQTFAAGGRAEEPKKPTKKGYQFSGWYKDEELTVKYNFNAAVYVDTKLYPKWTEGEAASDSSGSTALPWILAAAAVVILALVGVLVFKKKGRAKNGQKK